MSDWTRDFQTATRFRFAVSPAEIDEPAFSGLLLDVLDWHGLCTYRSNRTGRSVCTTPKTRKTRSGKRRDDVGNSNDVPGDNMELSQITLFINILSGVFVVVIGTAFLGVAAVYVVDRSQRTQAVRHNFPVIGRFRYLFEHWASFSVSTSSPWTVRRCPSIARSVRGSIAPQKVSTARSRSDRPVT